MKFICNTSFNPHFCALFSAKEALVDALFWERPKEDSQKIWDFCHRHKIRDLDINFLGAVSGPGSFSSLRASSVIMQSLSFYFKCDIHQIRADKVIHEFLNTIPKSPKLFLLNSFSSGVFLPEGDLLKKYDIIQASELIGDTACFTGLLPTEKAKHIKNKVEYELNRIENVTLKTLNQTKSSKVFVPDYEYPPVQ